MKLCGSPRYFILSYLIALYVSLSSSTRTQSIVPRTYRYHTLSAHHVLPMEWDAVFMFTTLNLFKFYFQAVNFEISKFIDMRNVVFLITDTSNQFLAIYRSACVPIAPGYGLPVGNYDLFHCTGCSLRCNTCACVQTPCTDHRQLRPRSDWPRRGRYPLPRCWGMQRYIYDVDLHLFSLLSSLLSSLTLSPSLSLSFSCPRYILPFTWHLTSPSPRWRCFSLQVFTCVYIIQIILSSDCSDLKT